MATHSQADYELLRRCCAALKDQHWSQVKIAEALGLTEGWVSQALKKYRQETGFIVDRAGFIWSDYPRTVRCSIP